MTSILDNNEKLNELVYQHISEILKTLDKKIDIKIYSISNNDKIKYQEIFRVKRTFSIESSTTKIRQEKLPQLENLFSELGIEKKFELNEMNNEFIIYCNQDEFLSRGYKTNSETNETLNEKKISDNVHTEDFLDRKYRNEELFSKVLYVNNFKVKMGKNILNVIYIIEIRNVEYEMVDTFYNYPELSYLRMVLDYFFIDYYEKEKADTLKISTTEEMKTKYNENSLQFNRRLTRLFYGKIHDISVKKNDIDELEKSFVNESNNQYYISNLFETIDDISNLTYEGISPFGSILFFNSGVFNENKSLLEFTIKFQLDDLISLSDSKLVRKLLELTTDENDLYLLADHEKIYGLGRINWNQLDKSIVFKLDFKGISKYDIHLITTKDARSDEGNLETIEGKKIFKTTHQFEIVNKNLLKISFKNPHFSGDGYTGEKFRRLLKSEYFDSTFEINNEVSKYLNEVIMQAREQKHGTMVVITDYTTAIEELKILKKQAISIETTKISPEYIRFLTSIDGAIYFDTNGKCHAIGVILDGLAKGHIGDSGRGARYNSAHRYLEKLKGLNKKCLIVIISEDGIVNLIPEPENEEKIYALFQQLIDLIRENETEEKEIELKELEELLLSKEIVDYHLFFEVAEVYRDKNNFDKAIDFYKKGMDFASKNTILLENYRYIADLYYRLANSLSKSPEKIPALKEAKNYFDKYINKDNENDLSSHDYNLYAITLYLLGTYDNNNQAQLFKISLENFTKAIKNNNDSAILYFNRSYLNIAMDRPKEAIIDLLEAEFLSKEKTYSDHIVNLVENNNELLDLVVDSIVENINNTEKAKNLALKLLQIDQNLIEKYPNVELLLI